MRNSTASRKGPPDEVQIISISFKAIVIIATIFGNFLVLKAFYKFPSLRTASNSILVSLSVADSLTVIPFILHISFIALGLEENPHAANFKFLCKSSARFSLVTVSVITLHLTLISVERVIAIKFALRYHAIVTSRRAMIACFIVWLLAIAVTLLFPLALSEDGNECSYERLYKALHPCFKFRVQARERAFRQNRSKMSISSTKGYLAFLVISLLVIPMLTILCSYGYIFLVARNHRRQIRYQADSQGVSTFKSELKGAYTLATVVGVCLLSLLPLLVVTSFRFFGAAHVIRKTWLKYIVYDVALGLNACLNPVIYVWKHAKFKRAFRQLLMCS